jgi:CRP-like cAMP-binding protein
VTSAIKQLRPFTGLTEAEAQFLEAGAEPREFAPGESLDTDSALFVILEGGVRLEVDARDGRAVLGALEAGGLLGEMGLFEPDRVRIHAVADKHTECLVWTLADLKSSFRYSRTAAAKFMAVFSASLSQKIRLANALLERAPDAASGDGRPRELDALDLKRLRSFAVSRDFEPGTVIFEEGDTGRELFVIAEGEVDILKKADDQTLTLASLGPGDFFGEMAFVDASPRSAGAVARSSLHVHVIGANSLERIFQYNVGTALYFTNVLCKIMARRLDATLRRIVPA